MRDVDYGYDQYPFETLMPISEAEKNEEKDNKLLILRECKQFLCHCSGDAALLPKKYFPFYIEFNEIRQYLRQITQTTANNPIDNEFFERMLGSEPIMQTMACKIGQFERNLIEFNQSCFMRPHYQHMFRINKVRHLLFQYHEFICAPIAEPHLFKKFIQNNTKKILCSYISELFTAEEVYMQRWITIITGENSKGVKEYNPLFNGTRELEAFLKNYYPLTYKLFICSKLIENLGQAYQLLNISTYVENVIHFFRSDEDNFKLLSKIIDLDLENSLNEEQNKEKEFKRFDWATKCIHFWNTNLNESKKNEAHNPTWHNFITEFNHKTDREEKLSVLKNYLDLYPNIALYWHRSLRAFGVLANVPNYNMMFFYPASKPKTPTISSKEQIIESSMPAF